MERDYLHRCRDLFGLLTRVRYGRTQHIERIEDATARIRSRRKLTYADIDKIRDSRIWNADVFGYWPARDEIESAIESTQWDFWNLPKREIKAIAGLFLVFRQIEPVSVILRFLVPKHYGIMSPPVEKVLGLGSFRRHPEKYRTYLTNLRVLRDDRGFDTVADVDGEMERMRHQRLKTGVDAPADEQSDPSPPTALTGFWSESTVDELASEQGIVVPQHLDAVIGAGSDLWDDNDAFDLFVQGIHDRRLERSQGSGDER